MKKKKQTKKRKSGPDVTAIMGRLFASSDDFMLSVARWMVHAGDGSSRKVIEAVEKALQHSKDVRLLYAALDPKHYRGE